MRSASGFMGYVGWRSDGVMQAYNAVNTGISASIASAAFPTSQWVRVEAAVQAGTDTTNGLLEYAYYLGDSLTPVFSWSSSAVNTGTLDPIQTRFGVNGASTTPGSVWWDSMGLGDGAGYLGIPGGTGPTAIVTDDLAHVIDARTSTGTGLTYGIAQTSGTTVTPTLLVAGLWSIVPHATSTINYTVTVTATGGATDTDTVSIAPLSAATAQVRRYHKVGGTFV